MVQTPVVITTPVSTGGFTGSSQTPGPFILTGIVIPPLNSSSIFGRRKKKVIVTKKQGYYPEIKVKGKWKRFVPNPRTEREAAALAGNIVDNSTAVQFRLIKAKKKAIKETIRRSLNQNKFRDYSFRAGKKKQLPNKGMIEKKSNRIDTLGEKKQLSAAKVVKGKRFKSLTRAPTRRKTPSRRRKSGGLLK